MDFCLRCKPRLKTLAAEIFTPSNSTVDSYFTIDEGWICLAGPSGCLRVGVLSGCKFSTLLFILVFIVTSEVMHFSLNYFRLSRFHYERNRRLENGFERLSDSISYKKAHCIGEGSELFCVKKKKQFTVKYALICPVSVGFNIICVEARKP